MLWNHEIDNQRVDEFLAAIEASGYTKRIDDRLRLMKKIDIDDLSLIFEGIDDVLV